MKEPDSYRWMKINQHPACRPSRLDKVGFPPIGRTEESRFLSLLVLTLLIGFFPNPLTAHDIVKNGGFEAPREPADDGFHAPWWNISNQFSSCIVEDPNLAHSGNHCLRFSGRNGEDRAWVQQTIQLPADGNTYLTFQLHIPASEVPGEVALWLGDYLLWQASEAEASQFRSYQPVTIDLTELRDGGHHTLHLESWIREGNTRFLIDDLKVSQSNLTSIERTTVTVPDLSSRPTINKERSIQVLKSYLSQEEPWLRVMVHLETELPQLTDQTHLTDPMIEDRERAINAVQDRVDALIDPITMRSMHRFQYIPYVALTVNGTGLDRLGQIPLVSNVHIMKTYEPSQASFTGDLSSTARQIGADVGRRIGVTGNGQTVAVIDSGVRSDHPDLQGRIVSEACYSRNPDIGDLINPFDTDYMSLCPNEEDSQTGTGAAQVEPFTNIAKLGHGTHVSGIIAEIAPDAGIIAIQALHMVETETEGEYVLRTDDEDYTKALERVLQLRNSFNIASVNMSLGGGVHTGHCDAFDTFFGGLFGDGAVKEVSQALTQSGIAVIASSGNEGYTNQIGSPSCISSIISVASVGTSNQVSLFSNVNQHLDFYAPGEGIRAADLYTDDLINKSGTSMAAPHVSAAWALVKEAFPNRSVSEILRGLRETGTPIDDRRRAGTIKDLFQSNEALHANLRESLWGFFTVDRVFENGKHPGRPLIQVDRYLSRESDSNFTASGFSVLGPVEIGANETELITDLSISINNFNETVGGDFEIAFQAGTQGSQDQWLTPKNSIRRFNLGPGDSRSIPLIVDPNKLQARINNKTLKVTHRDYLGTIRGEKTYVLEVDKSRGASILISDSPYLVTLPKGKVTSRELLFFNVGDETLHWQAESDQSWLTVDSESGSVSTKGLFASNEETLVLRIDASSLSPGSHTGHITLKSNANNKPSVRRRIALTVVGAELSVSSGSSFFLLENATTRRKIGISAVGPLGLKLDWTAASNRSWLKLDKTSGSSTVGGSSQLVELSVSSNGLAQGRHEAAITIRTRQEPIQERIHQVVLNVASDAEIRGPTATRMSTSSPSRVVAIFLLNRTTADVTWALSSRQSWLRPNGPIDSGTVPRGQSGSVPFHIDVRGLVPGDYQGQIDLKLTGGTSKTLSYDFEVILRGPSVTVTDENNIEIEDLNGFEPIPEAIYPIDFGVVPLGESRTRTVWIRNNLFEDTNAGFNTPLQLPRSQVKIRQPSATTAFNDWPPHDAFILSTPPAESLNYTEPTNATKMEIEFTPKKTGNDVALVQFSHNAFDTAWNPKLYMFWIGGQGIDTENIDEQPLSTPAHYDLILATNRDGNQEIYRGTRSGTNLRNLTNHDASDVSPASSPDGSQIVFVSDRDGDREIFVMNSDGSNVVQLTHNDTLDASPAWSPDGKKIAFISNRTERNVDVWVMNADGTDPLRITEAPHEDNMPHWSPDGSQIVFSYGLGNNREIYTMTPNGGSRKQLTNNNAADLSPAWSPDGEQIAFVTNRDGNSELYVMQSDGSNPRNLSKNTADDGHRPSWIPDGTKIAFRSNRSGDYDIFLVSPGGSDLENLTQATGSDEFTPHWLPVYRSTEPSVLESVDLEQHDLTLAFPGDVAWSGQSAVHHDGIDALQSGLLGPQQTSDFELLVSGPLDLTFWWKTTSPSNDQVLTFQVDGEEAATVAGEQDWEFKEVSLSSGDHVLRWTYANNSTNQPNDGAKATAWVDQIQLNEPKGFPLTIQASGGRVVTSPSQLIYPVDSQVEMLALPDPGYEFIEWAGDYHGTENPATIEMSAERSVVAVFSLIPLPPEIFTQPTINGSTLGGVAALNVVVNGTPPLEYQWFHDGIAIPDANRPILTIVNLGPSDIGTYHVTVENAFGTASSESVILEIPGLPLPIRPVPTIGKALNAPELAFESGGHSRWHHQAVITHDEEEAAQSGAIDLEQESRITLALTGPGRLSFWWKVSSEESADEFTLMIDETIEAVISGEVDWTLRSVGIPTGDHTISWVYSKDGSIDEGQDAAWLDQVSFVSTLGSSPEALAEALDIEGVSVTNGGDAGWYVQQETAQDGISSAQSGPIADEQLSFFELELNGPGTLSFWWKVSSEDGADTLSYIVNDGVQADISGSVDWTEQRTELGPGAHKIRWQYEKDFNESFGADSGWIDQIVFEPTLLTKPTILKQPQSLEVALGTSASFFVSAEGTEPLNYQWSLNGNPIEGATAPAHTVENVQPDDAGVITVTVTNRVGTVISHFAFLTVQQPTGFSVTTTTTNGRIAKSPDRNEYQSGETVTLEAIPNPGFQFDTWTGDYANESNPFTLTITQSVEIAARFRPVLQRPVIVAQPSSAEIEHGSNVSFTVTAEGTGQLVYQWYRNGKELTGAIGPSISLHNVQPLDAGAYNVSVSNEGGTAFSSLAILTVVENNADSTPARIEQITILGDQRVRLQVSHPTAQRFRVEVSEDLARWAEVGMVTLTEGRGDFVDESAPLKTARFYRLVE